MGSGKRWQDWRLSGGRVEHPSRKWCLEFSQYNRLGGLILSLARRSRQSSFEGVRAILRTFRLRSIEGPIQCIPRRCLQASVQR